MLISDVNERVIQLYIFSAFMTSEKCNISVFCASVSRLKAILIINAVRMRQNYHVP